ncbi:hypothetical protein HS1genome_1720 [Sulfodiicoccus acidiphilus]|uniref:Calcineurin-like phosphoesterase domain-containing protein n=1 Tax=Sulfodiicoccus acidiphilus TaxID=1670455 RepID=A0A348B579_9CREN|nr:metallophosphoesterase [Sulfodiicoccus acidiphilus]BBD73331.1 hypothetical protein HS1genome_1720 [Sulfodiicoccus acidiphilus]GGT89049.1 hypothetical protein GCM10007116_03590 [Sulfodiicoccus acidiphilus]
MILFVSDVHKSYKRRRVDETVAVDWLLKVIKKWEPDYLISAGDWDEGMSPEDFQKIGSLTKFLTVYGNHENFPLIKPIAMNDGKAYLVDDFRVAGINGLVGSGRPYSISPEDFTAAFRRAGRRKVDILVMHQPPYLPEVYPNMRRDEGGLLALEAIREVSPRLFLNGHMTGECYTYYRFPWGTHYLRVDSSQECKHYAVLEGGKVKVYDNRKEVVSFVL